MTITRDPEFPAEIAQLANAFNHCADGSEPVAVLNASIQKMAAAAIGVIARSKGATLQQTESYTRHVTKFILTSVQENFQRAPKPTDIVVKTS
jgi:hypothetical protein